MWLNGLIEQFGGGEFLFLLYDRDTGMAFVNAGVPHVVAVNIDARVCYFDSKKERKCSCVMAELKHCVYLILHDCWLLLVILLVARFCRIVLYSCFLLGFGCGKDCTRCIRYWKTGFNSNSKPFLSNSLFFYIFFKILLMGYILWFCFCFQW